MRHFIRLNVVLSAVLLLAACSYFDKAEVVEVEKPAVPAGIDLLSGELIDDAGNLEARTTQGVEVFELDGTIVDPISGRKSSGGSGSYFSNPSVEVFPLDGALPQIERGVPVAPTVQSNYTGERSIVYFEHGETGLDRADKALIDQVAQNFRAAPHRLISVEGHASHEAVIAEPSARKAANLKVSTKRALSVAKGLIARGIPAESIRAVGWGETHADAPINGERSASTARRVEIIIQ